MDWVFGLVWVFAVAVGGGDGLYASTRQLKHHFSSWQCSRDRCFGDRRQ